LFHRQVPIGEPLVAAGQIEAEESLYLMDLIAQRDDQRGEPFDLAGGLDPWTKLSSMLAFG